MVLQFGLAASLSYMAIALLSLPMVGRTVIAFGLLCHLRACCLGNRCAMVLQFGLAALLSYMAIALLSLSMVGRTVVA